MAAVSQLLNRGIGYNPGSLSYEVLLGLSPSSAVVLDAAPGEFILTGFAADLEATTPGVVVLNALPGNFVLAGASAKFAITLSAAPGSFALTGAGATLGIGLNAAPGSFILTGVAANLVALETDVVLNAMPGSFVLHGASASLVIGSVNPVGEIIIDTLGFATIVDTIQFGS